MTIRDDFKPYIDLDGLVSNVASNLKQFSTCDNGLLFTAEYIRILRNNRLVEGDQFLSSFDFQPIVKCIDKDRYLHRNPQDADKTSPDDHYGVLSIANLYESPIPPIKMPWQYYLQPVLLYLWAAHRRYTILMPILSPIVAIILAFSNFSDPVEDTSNRLLTWCSLQAFRQLSHLGMLTWKIWYKRQKKLYNVDKPVRKMAEIYFGAAHPVAKYIE